MGRLKVFIDNREKHRVSEAIEFFNGFKDYETSVAELKTGDYVCGNCCVEYKTTGDFVSSVRNRRIFKQAIRMSESYTNHYVFIETEHAAIKEAGYEMPEIKLVACMPNCPVYDFVHISDGQLTNSGKKRLFGSGYKDQTMFELFCPKTHIDSLTCPTFVSTCKRDFLRAHSRELYKDLQERGIMSEIVDLETDDKTTGHVHNVLHPFRPFAEIINHAMVEFIEKARKR